MREVPAGDTNDPAPMDFAPFDPLANLEAVAEVIKTIRHLSWSYAGDIARVAIKIGKTFCAGRCVVCVAEAERIEVYEFSDGGLQPLQSYFVSPDGQSLLSGCLELGPECLLLFAPADDEAKAGGAPAIELVSGIATGEIPEALRQPSSYVFPLRHQYGKRHVVKPGLLLLQEPAGLARWNKRFLDSVVVVAEYLAMVIECERLYSIVHARKPAQE